MSIRNHNQEVVRRRDILKMFGAAGAASTLPLGAAALADEPVSAAATSLHHPTVVAGGQVSREGYEFFNVDESEFIEAAVDTPIPSDATGPGAGELGVATYIDRQMVSGYGKGDRLYLDAPFGDGTPEQGYQLSMTPSELIRAGIADIGAYAREKYGTSFASLSVEDRAAIMTDLDSTKVELATVPTTTFFGVLLQVTIEGYFADPIYGGNKGGAAWRMIGFPGAEAMYMDKIEPFRNKPYATEPKGIQDLI